MSDDSTFAPEGEAPAEAPAPEYGQGEAEATPEPTYLDTDQYAGHHVRLRVDGEEVAVPLSEALSGYSRQADYTRKTQELARQQQDAQFAITLQRALENNPQATLRLLQDQYGLTETAQPQSDDDSWMDDDPVEQRLREYDQRLQAHEEYRAQQELRVALGVLQQRYGPDFDPAAVASRAAQMGRMDLENIYKEMAFEKYWTQEQASRAHQAKEAERVAAKQGLTAHGGSGTNGAVAEPPKGNATSIAAAYHEAKRQHGIT